MGRLLKLKKYSTGFEVFISLIGLVLVGGAIYFFAPGLRVAESKTLEAISLNKDNIDNVAKGTVLQLPSNTNSTAVASKPLTRIMEYAWNANSGMIVSTGGPRTSEGSIMETLGVNLEIVRKDQFSQLRDAIVNFVADYDAGKAIGENAAHAVSIMGDGGPFFISTTQKLVDDKFGKGKYHIQGIGAIGLSHREDKVIGPAEWKNNPQLMKGAVISAVIGDGDWVLAVNYCFANKLKVNSDPTTYDAEAVNFVPSKDDDYMNSAKELVASVQEGYTIPLKEVVNGKLTGKTVEKPITASATWTPGDKYILDRLSGYTDIVSTGDFVNQMATTLITVKEWALQNEKTVVNILKGAYMGGNQIKLSNEWAVRASQAVCKTYNLETPAYWYKMFKGYDTTKNGVSMFIGGSKVFNYADAMQYFGLTDGVNRYKSVYDQVSNYLVKLNPGGFNESIKEVVPYDDAVNLYFLKSVNITDAGKTDKIDYSTTKNEVLASGEWNINFASGKATIQGSSTSDLETIYNLLSQAEETKVKIVGHTDNTGTSDGNLILSKSRANAVVTYLESRGITSDRFQFVDGLGDTQPIADNTSVAGKAKNRRVQITILK